MTSSTAALLIGGAYLSGSVPFGLLVGRLKGVDVRHVGSGNIGATNVGRALGTRWAATVLLLDAAKGFLPVLLARGLSHDVAEPWPIAGCMLAAVLGHIFSLFLRFRGGKGVATGLGVTLAVDPIAAAAGLCGYGLAYLVRRISAIGSLAGAATALICVWYRGAPVPILLALGLIVGLIVLRHRENFRRS